MAASEKPVRIINSTAPMRICDNGGWTDTWFCGHGKVFNIAVRPYAEVQVSAYRRRGDRPRITINAENYGDRYSVSRQGRGEFGKHPLLEAALEYMKIPRDLALEVSIFSDAPSGCSTGTSAAVSVALIGALDCLTPGRMAPHEVAITAHRIETELLRQQCGIQDQIASVYGGINYIEMFRYPHASVSQVRVSDALWWELERRLALIYVGQTHSSSKVHRMVIRELERSGRNHSKLEPLRRTAEMSRDALYAGDLAALGKAMIRNTEAQAGLHAELIGPRHRAIIDIARRHGVAGWKVNGAGGEGGSVTLLCNPGQVEKRALLRAVEQADPAFKVLPIYLCRYGLRVWESAAARPSRTRRPSGVGKKGK